MDRKKTKLTGLMQGFTLIELLIAMTITTLLISCAYSSYTYFLKKTHKSDAQISLKEDQFRFEHCFAQNASYSLPCPERPLFPHYSIQGFYTLTLSHLSDRTYTLSAIAKEAQDNNSKETPITITESSS